MARPIVRRNTTLARLSFFTFDAPPPLNRIDAYDEFALPGLGIPNESSLVGFEFSKNLGEAAGRINITLKGKKLKGTPVYAGQPWPKLIAEGDWWSLDVIKNGVNIGLSFGKIDGVGADIQAGMGEGTVVVTVNGRDVGYALEDTPVFFNPHNPILDNALGVQMMTIIDRAVGSPGQLIPNVIKGYLGGLGLDPFAGHHQIPGGLVPGTPVDASGAVRWVDAVDFTSCVQQTLRGLLLAQPMFTPSPQSIWDYVQAWRNPVLNELFIDSVPEPGFPKQACLVMREKPFVNATQGIASPWFSLRTWNIDASMIAGMNVQRGPNRVNYVSLSGEMLVGINEESMVSTFLTVANKSSVSKYGLKRLEEYTRYMDDSKNTAAQIEHNDWLALIVAWNAINHDHWQGQITLGEMRPEIRPGDKIAVLNGPPAQYGAFPTDLGVPAAALTFYVEGVQHRYMTGQSPVAQTTLTVSRGYAEASRAKAVVAEASPLTWENLLTTTGSRNNPVQLNTTTPLQDALLDTSPILGEYKVDSNAELL